MSIHIRNPQCHNPLTAGPRQPVVHWPFIAGAGAGAMLFVGGLLLGLVWLRAHPAGPAEEGPSAPRPAPVAGEKPAPPPDLPPDLPVHEPVSPPATVLAGPAPPVGAPLPPQPAAVSPPPSGAPPASARVAAQDPTHVPAQVLGLEAANVLSPPAGPSDLPDPALRPRPAPAALTVDSDPDPFPGEAFGTAVGFLGSPSEAARKAVRERKLLLVLHVSGNFEDARFT